MVSHIFSELYVFVEVLEAGLGGVGGMARALVATPGNSIFHAKADLCLRRVEGVIDPKSTHYQQNQPTPVG